MEKLRYGIVGVGNMGSAHSKNLMEGKVEEAVLGAVCDIDPTKIAAFKEKYPEIPTFDCAEDMYKSGLIDAVVVAIPHYDHPKYVIMAFEAGLHVITEKPAGVYTKQVLEMNEAAKKSDKLFGIMYNQRTNPTYALIREMVQSGELGHIKRIQWTITNWYRSQSYHDSAAWRSTWATEGGGTLINQNPHQLDLWQWMFGMPKTLISHAFFGKYRNIEVEDEVTAYMEYENGTTGVYITSIAEAPGTNRLEIACDAGRLIVEDNKIRFDKLEMPEPEFDKTWTKGFGTPKCETIYPEVTGDAGLQHIGILQNFASAVLHGTPLLAPGFEGINGLTISNAMHYSTWKGNVAVDLENFPHDDFYAELQKKIAASTVDKGGIKAKAVDLTGTY